MFHIHQGVNEGPFLYSYLRGDPDLKVGFLSKDERFVAAKQRRNTVCTLTEQNAAGEKHSGLQLSLSFPINVLQCRVEMK